MHKIGAVGAAGVFAVLILAGCVGGGGDSGLTTQGPSTPVGSARIAPSAEPTEDASGETGSITGVVMDEELRPLPQASVLLVEEQTDVRVDGFGAFAFLDVPGGRYVVEAHAPGHIGQSIRVNVHPGDKAEVRFELPAIPVREPRVEFLEHVMLMNWSVGAAGIESVVPGQCDDRCRWYSVLPGLPDLFLVEVFGEHASPHPRGWDGVGSIVNAYQLNGSGWTNLHHCAVSTSKPQDWNAECQRLPVRIPFQGDVLTAENNPDKGALERIRVSLSCEPSWFCLNERYEITMSLFYDWEGEEVPPDFSSRSGG